MVAENQAIGLLKQKIDEFPKTLVMLGSGWDRVVDQVQIDAEISYTELFGATTSVPGHAGKFIVGRLNGVRVGFMAGRLHMYEGYTARETTLPVRVFNACGVGSVIITSASGAINEKYRVGDLIVLSDLLTLLLSPDNPLIGPEFVDMSQVFDATLRQSAIAACAQHSLPFHEGIYAYAHGPHYETPADKMALKILGADVVGMSTVPEAIMARALGMRILGLSCVTNLAFVEHKHEDVVGAAQAASEGMVALLTDILKNV